MVTSQFTCTKQQPATKEHEGLIIYHRDAKRVPELPLPRFEGDKSVMHCPNCGLEFTVTLGKKVNLKQLLEERDRG